MEKQTYTLLESYMHACMQDSAHDKEHVYRVLYSALEIAKTEDNVDTDVLIAACLLHDIGRKEQFENPQVCHAMAGGEKAFQFLMEHQFDTEFANQVRHCIQTHRFRKNSLPQSIEAKILFDADKLDASGAIGIARTLIYMGIVTEPIYTLLPNGEVSDGSNDTTHSFFREYKFKLERIYDQFYTGEGSRMAKARQQAAVSFYENLYREMNSSHMNGKRALIELLSE